MKREQLTHADYTALTIEFISMDLQKEDGDLFETKWWDYKFLAPMEATYLFAEYYKKAIKQAIKRKKCVYRGNNYKGLKNDDFLMCSKRVITGMWKARQAADALGIEYEFYCTQAMKYTEVRDHKFLPFPHQIYSTKKKKKDSISMVEHILLEWQKVNNNRLLHAQTAFYTLDAFCDNKYQNLHQRYLINYLKEKKSKQLLLVVELCFEKKILSRDVVEAGLENGKSLLKRAEAFLEN